MRDERTRLIVDTDMGVDDAVALGWLFAQTEVAVSLVGITTVAGNTTVENVTRNVAALLEVAGKNDLPLVQGAAKPLQQPLSGTSMGVHGPDGLWGAAQAHAPSAAVTEDAPAFLAEHAAPDVTLVTLGLLTNVAHAWRRYPDKLRSLKEIIVLGGARRGGNRTPVAEFNIWSDPEAAADVMESDLPLTLIPLDAFAQLLLLPEDVEAFSRSPHPLAQFLAGPLEQYVQIQSGRGRVQFTVPDAVALMYALDPSVGESVPALVRVIPGIEESGRARLLRGQTIVGLSPDEKMAMLADDEELSEIARQIIDNPAGIPAAIGAVLARAAGDVQLVVEIEAARMRENLLRAFR